MSTPDLSNTPYMEYYDFNARIAVLETELKNIANEVKASRLDSKEQHMMMMQKIQEMDKRLDVIEKWRWMIIGGATAIGYIAAQYFKT